VLASSFLFATCQPGAEAALKRELARRQPSWAPAYQRPGLITLRSPKPLTPELTLDAVLVRRHGISLGTVERELLVSRIRELPGPVCLQVIDRDPIDPDAPASETVRQNESELRAALADHITDSNVARSGELVVSVIVGEDEPPLLGVHRHGEGRSPYPGARVPIDLPEAAPSRAYLKVEEAIQAFALPLRPGDTALELGAAPGGAAYALLQRGVRVFAVDPAAMDERVLHKAGPSGAKVVHLPIAMRDLRRDQLPGRVDWLLMDVHLAPQIAMRAARRWASELRPTLCGAVLTLKLNDWTFADQVDDFVAQTKDMGLIGARAKQLASHRRELAIIGLTKRGITRV
jgi:23S rRNA (cytidine2498-2'-O)-methyltransferase